MVHSDPLNGGPRIVAIVTDFGSDDAYVAAMKGVIYAALPGARIVDISHNVAPQDTFQAAFLLETSWRFFPAETVFLCVVDPGVGTERKRLAIASGGCLFIGPDNGCLSPAVEDSVRGHRSQGEPYRAGPKRLLDAATAVAIGLGSVGRGAVSATFEGRDIFAPAAAHLARGGAISDLGLPAADAITFPALHAPSNAGKIWGCIIHVDRFGNLISDIHASEVKPGAQFRLGRHTLPGRRTYAEGEGAVAIIGTSGLVEVSVPGGRADETLGARRGDALVGTYGP